MTTTAFSQNEKQVFILVHGSWHGAWCWNKLAPLMEAKDDKVVIFDLPGHGSDTIPPAMVSLDDCVQKLVGVARAETGPVILVGHSSGGVIIAQAAEKLGKGKVAGLIFLDAFIPKDGESVFSLAEKYAPSSTPLSKIIVVSGDQKTVSLNTEKAIDLLYHDCSPEIIHYATAHLKNGPIAVLATPVQLTGSNYGSIPKYYVLCTQARDMDKTALSKNMPTKRIYTISSSHSPFFSMPGELATILHEIGKNNY